MVVVFKVIVVIAKTCSSLLLIASFIAIKDYSSSSIVLHGIASSTLVSFGMITKVLINYYYCYFFL